MSLLRKVNGKLEVVSGANSSGLPLGSIIPIYSVTVPTGFLPCDGSQYDTTQYPALYALLGSDRLPDLRESALVGIGTSDRAEITDHDVYTLGQFKDDQLQEHTHYTKQTTLTGFESNGFLYTRQSNPGYDYTGDKQIEGVKDGRVGTTTHGKQTGVFFVIKAVTGLTTGSSESIEVADVITAAEATLESKFDAILNDKTVLAEAVNTYTQAVEANTQFADSLLNYEEVWFYARQAAGSQSPHLPVSKFTHEQLADCIANKLGAFTFGYYQNYRHLKFNNTGEVATYATGDVCIYKVIGYRKRA